MSGRPTETGGEMSATLIIVGFVTGVCILACAFLAACLLQHRGQP